MSFTVSYPFPRCQQVHRWKQIFEPKLHAYELLLRDQLLLQRKIRRVSHSLRTAVSSRAVLFGHLLTLRECVAFRPTGSFSSLSTSTILYTYPVCARCFSSHPFYTSCTSNHDKYIQQALKGTINSPRFFSHRTIQHSQLCLLPSATQH